MLRFSAVMKLFVKPMASGYTAALPATRLTTKERLSRRAEESHDHIHDAWSGSNAEAYEKWFCETYGVDAADICEHPTVGPSQSKQLDDANNLAAADAYDDQAAADEILYVNRTFCHSDNLR